MTKTGKKVFFGIALVLAILMLLSIAIADIPDYSSMSFDELDEMKKALDYEYNSRPEANGIPLTEGEYLVGRDIKPGQFYVAVITPDKYFNTIGMSVYPKNNKNANLKFIKAFHFGDEPVSVILEDNDLIFIQNGSVLLKSCIFKLADYYTFEPPAGTVVPIGTYIVGEDIPVGTYNAYPASVNGGKYQIWMDIENSNGVIERKYKYDSETPINLYVRKEIDCNTITFENGDVFNVTYPVILSKKPKLQFD